MVQINGNYIELQDILQSSWDKKREILKLQHNALIDM